MTSQQIKDGLKMLLDGQLADEHKLGRQASVLTVWMLRPGNPAPRFVTAYPDP